LAGAEASRAPHCGLARPGERRGGGSVRLCGSRGSARRVGRARRRNGFAGDSETAAQETASQETAAPETGRRAAHGERLRRETLNSKFDSLAPHARLTLRASLCSVGLAARHAARLRTQCVSKSPSLRRSRLPSPGAGIVTADLFTIVRYCE